jgi:poly(3-hydroxybutyrate) depolymerase
MFSNRSLSAVTVLAFAAVTAGCSSDDPVKAGDPADSGTKVVPGPTLPAVAGTCPEMAEGAQQFLGKNVLLHVPPEGAPKGGPLVFYWHGSGSSTLECSSVLGATLTEITAAGGVVACMDGGQSTGEGDFSGPYEWYDGDYNVADEVVACATEKFELDPKRIHALGMSAGGLQSSQMVLRRAYMASAVSMSGGCIACGEPPDPSNKVPMMLFHGSWEADVVGVHFYDLSRNLANVLLERGQFAVDCNHNGGHTRRAKRRPTCGGSSRITPTRWIRSRTRARFPTASPSIATSSRSRCPCTGSEASFQRQLPRRRRLVRPS